jgi:hypothetical protein
MEGIIAESRSPRIKDDEVWYHEYNTEDLVLPIGQDFITF